MLKLLCKTFPQKVKALPYDPSISFLGIYPDDFKNMYRKLYANVLGNIIFKYCFKMETNLTLPTN